MIRGNENGRKGHCVIVRAAPSGDEILLFRHSYTGIQIPAGTIKSGQEPKAATLREAFEETGLAGFAYARPTPDTWPIETDGHHFTLFWAPLSAPPVIVAPQAPWLSMLQ